MQSIKNRLLWLYVGNLYSERECKMVRMMEEITKISVVCCVLPKYLFAMVRKYF